MDRLAPVVFHDAWGSHVSIASLQGRDIPSDEPESELWMGAHEEGPSGTSREGAPDLAAVVAADPEGELGADCVQRFGPRLPFLLKVLAPGRAISIQAHPTAEQARSLRATTGDAGLRRRLGQARAAPRHRTVRGVRRPAHPRRGRDTRGPAARAAAHRRSSSAPPRPHDPAHALLAGVLATPADEVGDFAREVVAACVRLEARADDLGRASAAVARVAEEHPDDIGLVVLLLMHHRVLQPGEYIDVAAGVLHSYVGGSASRCSPTPTTSCAPG